MLRLFVHRQPAGQAPFVVLAVVLLAALQGDCASAEEPTDKLTYELDVRPILKAQCFHCHGEQGEVEGGLDLRLRKFIAAGGDSGPALVAGDPAASLIMERIESGEMPPEDKQLTAEEMDVIRRWIAQGAVTAEPEPESIDDTHYWTLAEREFWSFQPITQGAVPSSEHPSAANGVDAFIHAGLQSQGLEVAPLAGAATLARRLAFDLHGLPPSPGAVQRLVDDPRPDAYSRHLDRALAAGAYGERWGRHWLDVAGYADSEGFVDADPVRPWAFRYRDYVIDAFNSGMSLDQFVIEQLAGDEMVEQPYENLEEPDIRRLVATGFLRMAPDGTGAGGVDQTEARNEVMAGTIEIVGTSLLGMTVACARCHDHRYDPISQSDYYALRAVFEPAMDWKSWKTPVQRQISLYRDADRELAASVEARAKEAERERSEIEAAHLQRTLREELVKAPADLQDELRTAYQTAAAERSDEQKALLKEYPNIGNISAGSLYLYSEQRVRRANEIVAVADQLQAKEIERLKQAALAAVEADVAGEIQAAWELAREQWTETQTALAETYPQAFVDATTWSQFAPEAAQKDAEYREMAEVCRATDAKKQLADLKTAIGEIRQSIPPEPFVRALWETPGHQPETFVFTRGNPNQPAESVGPGELPILAQHNEVTIPFDNEALPTSGRRLAYAQHLTNGRHPLLARVLANRWWMHHFGRGIVNSPGDFGQLGDRPTHPELLDWLASRLMKTGWDPKKLHREILTSYTYRQSSARTEQGDRVDPDNQWLSRQTLRRLEAETVRDAVLAVSGELVQQMYGAPIPVKEDGVGQIVLGVESLDGERKPTEGASLGADEHRRSLYVQVRRSRPLAVLEPFDGPTLTPNCTQRASSNDARQSLLLMNSEFITNYAQRMAKRLEHETPGDVSAQVARGWELAYGTPISESERQQLIEFVTGQAERFAAAEPDKPVEELQLRALGVACHALLASNRFLYVD